MTGCAPGCHSSRPSVAALGRASSSTWPRSTGSTPSTSAWWVLESSATRPSAEALDEVDLPQRRLRSSGRETIRATSSRSCSRCPGAAARSGARGSRGRSRVVDPDRVGQVAGHRRPAAGSGARTRSGRRPARPARRSRSPRARVEDLDGRVVAGRGRRLLGQEGQVARPQPLAHLPPCAGPLVRVHGILTEVSAWTGRAAALKGHTMRRLPHLIAAPTSCSPPRSASPAAATATARGPASADRPGHRRHVDRRLGHPNGERIEVPWASRSSLDVTADAPVRSTCTPRPEQEFEYKAGTHARPHPDRRPGVVDVESHTLDKIIVQLQVQ